MDWSLRAHGVLAENHGSQNPDGDSEPSVLHRYQALMRGRDIYARKHSHT